MPPVNRLMIGLIRSATSEPTIAVNAAPMMMPTAMSMTLPRAMKVLNSLSMGMLSLVFVCPSLQGPAYMTQVRRPVTP